MRKFKGNQMTQCLAEWQSVQGMTKCVQRNDKVHSGTTKWTSLQPNSKVYSGMTNLY